MITLKGAYEKEPGEFACESCGSPSKRWEKMSTEQIDGGTVYVFRCKRCKSRIEIINRKSQVDQM